MRNGGELSVEYLAPAIEHAIKARAPFVLELHVDRDIKPPAMGTWQWPPLPHGEPAFRARRLPQEETR